MNYNSLLNKYLIIAVIIFIIPLIPDAVFALEKTVLKGQVTNIEGKAVKGSEIFIYNTSNTRRPADFISARTDINGRYNITLPPGKYWAVARLRKGEKYGPLMLGDKHSGEPVEVEIDAGEGFEQDFTVIDIRESARMIRKTGADHFKLKGKIIDKKGSPLKDVYAFADRERKVRDIPDYISAWTDEEGNYTLYLPAGKYYVGYASAFPPGLQYKLSGELQIESDRNNFDITADSRESASGRDKVMESTK